jgi:hypothetical protein
MKLAELNGAPAGRAASMAMCPMMKQMGGKKP